MHISTFNWAHSTWDLMWQTWLFVIHNACAVKCRHICWHQYVLLTKRCVVCYVWHHWGWFSPLDGIISTDALTFIHCINMHIQTVIIIGWVPYQFIKKYKPAPQTNRMEIYVTPSSWIAKSMWSFSERHYWYKMHM